MVKVIVIGEFASLTLRCLTLSGVPRRWVEDADSRPVPFKNLVYSAGIKLTADAGLL